MRRSINGRLVVSGETGNVDQGNDCELHHRQNTKVSNRTILEHKKDLAGQPGSCLDVDQIPACWYNSVVPDVNLQHRPLLINLANRPNPGQCADCGARHIGLCNALSDHDLELLAGIAQRVTLPPGKVFIEEGSPAGHFYNINFGTIRLFKALPDGRRQITGFMGAGHFLGLKVSGSSAAPGHYMFSAEAIGEVHLCRFNRTSLMASLTQFPALERKLLDVATHELVVAQDQMLLLGRKTALERVASFLLAWAVQQALCAADHLPETTLNVALPMSRTDLADYLGVTIETISRALSQLKRDGLIEVPNSHEVILLHPRRLAALAEAEI
jgi:CRP/FNR family transcriptional regulator